MPNIGVPELVIILVIALLVLGPGRLPSVAQSLGKSIREFRKAASDVQEAASLDIAPAAAPTPAPAPAQALVAPPAAVAPPVAPAPAPASPVVADAVAAAPAPNTLATAAEPNVLTTLAEPAASAAEPVSPTGEHRP